MTHGSVVCLGEALVDMIEVPTDEGPMFLPAWGGSSLNVAVGVARLGRRVEFGGSFARDPLGQRLKDFLVAEKVGMDLSVDIEGQTTIAMTTFVNHEPRYSFYAHPASYGFLPPAIAIREQVAHASVVHGGSLGVLEPMTCEAMEEAFQATEGFVTFDPNVRPSMVTDWDDYRSRLGRLIRHAKLVKFSAEDIAVTYPGMTPEAIAQATLDQGAQAVIVTEAQDGATLVTHDQTTRLPIAAGFSLKDTTGGGDSTMAAMIAQIDRSGVPSDHSGWLSYLENALIVAAVVCSRSGGAIAMPTLEEARGAGARL